MSLEPPHSPDRIEAFVASIDAYEPQIVAEHEDLFRVFARYISRSLDNRYLERHPPSELLLDLENIMQSVWQMPADKIIVHGEVTNSPTGPRGIILTCLPDQHFIYSIVWLALESLGLDKTYRSINSVVPIVRNAAGEIVSVATQESSRESLIWVEVDPESLQARLQEVKNYIHHRLAAARSVVEDFDDLTALVRNLAGRFAQMAASNAPMRETLENNARLLNWLLTEHFVFLGTRYVPMQKANAGFAEQANYGIGRIEGWHGMQWSNFAHDLNSLHGKPPHLWVRKTDTEAWIYRSGRNDRVVVQHFDDQFEPIGFVIIEGLFSFPALSESRTSVPLLDRMLDQIFAQMQAIKGSQRYRSIRNAFNSLPLEYLFTLSFKDIRKLIDQVLAVDVQHRLQVHITLKESEAAAFVFVALPRSHFSEECRHEIQNLLRERFSASAIDDGIYAGDLESVTFHYYLTGVKALPEEVQETLKQEIEQLASPWEERLLDELMRHFPKAAARSLFAAYYEAFSHRYKEETAVARAVADIKILESLNDANPFACDVYQEIKEQPLNITRIRMFQITPLLLSSILPILDNFGLTVIDQFPTSVHIPNRPEYSVATFRIRNMGQNAIDLNSRQARLRSAIVACVRNLMSADAINKLLLRADIPWPSVVLIHAYYTYARLLGLPFGQSAVYEALLQHADIVRSLTEMFRIKFDPDVEGLSGDVDLERRLQMVDRSRRAILLQLESVEDLTSDEILRTLFNLLEATVRTNFYARNQDQISHLVLKFDPSLVARMPSPRPYREIFVFHPEVAGLHLRGGPIARGGIRWSDRLLDFRTEVLGLMHTQNLKNALIVPRGAKGAFVLRIPNPDLTLRRAQADTMYRIFIGGLLEVTDNLVDGKLQRPNGVICYDPLDHYLVVAADKGTAHLSDTANELANQANFWLHDAFASGGSRGYDHKKEAITSRGAWECTKRHCREMGIDPEVDRISVVGIGDMSGDVFGNGMLRSHSMQLLAAFDHRHIFIDPNPDPLKSFLARKQLFEMPRSSWADYASAALSEGGGIYPRSAKSIRISAAAREALGITTEADLSGPQLVRAILTAPVDLLWNGGIGTYIKASDETDADVGDTTNDGVRVSANEVRAKIIAEGGNLGCTARGRVELAKCGVRLNNDATDNSAGVDLSDHEVNLKILFQTHAHKHGLSDQEVDNYLETLRVEVGESVLRHNWQQSRMIGLDVVRSASNLPRFMRAMRVLERNCGFSLKDMHMLDEREAKSRIQQGIGLYRPELAILASYAKVNLRQQLVASETLFNLTKLHNYLFAYFPKMLHERFADAVVNHPLGLDIARTVITNWIIDDTGISFLPEVELVTGQPPHKIINSYLDANLLLPAEYLKKSIEKIEKQIDATTEYKMRLVVEDALENVSIWLLRHQQLDLKQFLPIFQQTSAALVNYVEPSQLVKSLSHLTLPDDLLMQLSLLGKIDKSLDAAYFAFKRRIVPAEAVRMVHQVGEKSGLARCIEQAVYSISQDELDRPSRLCLQAHMRELLLSACDRAFDTLITQPDLPASLSQWCETVAQLLGSLEAADRPLCNSVLATDRIMQKVAEL